MAVVVQWPCRGLEESQTEMGDGERRREREYERMRKRERLRGGNV